MKRPEMRASLARAGRLAGVVAGYAASAQLARALSPERPYASFVWPPLGLGIAVLLLDGAALWPALAGSAFLVTLTVLARSPGVAAGVALSHAAAVLVAVAALRRFGGDRPLLSYARGVALLLGVGAAAGLLEALGGAAALALGGLIRAAEIPSTWIAWAASDAVGLLIVTPPLLLAQTEPGEAPGDRRRVEECAGITAATAGIAAVIFLVPQVSAGQRALLPPGLLAPTLLWAATRLGRRGVVTAMSLVAVLAVAGTACGRGPFAELTPSAALRALHVFLAVGSACALLIGAMVSDHARARAALVSSEALLRGIVEGTTDAVCVKDRRHRVVLANGAAARAFGVPAGSMIGKDIAQVMPPEAARRLRAVNEEILRTGEPRTVELALPVSGGATRVYEAASAPCRDGSGEVIGILAVARDVTELRAAHLARARLAALVESTGDAILGVCPAGTVTVWNSAAARLFGYALEEITGRPVEVLFAPGSRPVIARWLAQTCGGERVCGEELLGRRKDGRDVSLSLTISPTREPGSAIAGTSIIARDLTETAERLRLALDAVDLGMWFWHVTDNRLTWTPPCRAMHGVGPAEEISRDRWLAAIHPDDRGPILAALQRALREHDDYRVEYRVIWPDGQLRWLAARGRTLCDETGVAVRMMGSVLDVTPQKEAEQERSALLTAAETAARAKDTFLAVLSHELRTPMQAVLGYTALLAKRAPDPAALEKGLAVIERNARAQAQLIEDLLDVSRIVSGKLHLSRERVDLAELVEAAVETARPLAAAKSLRLHLAVRARPAPVLGDAHRLQQVVTNLLTNAAKFTPAGGAVAVRLSKQSAGTVAITVEDTGCGIAEDRLPRVFDRFYQVGSVTTRQHGGLGLGLAIVRHLVEAHGGSVHAESEGEGRGARFTVTLPLAADEPRALAADGASPGPVALDGVRVLVVGDDDDARALLAAVLADEGAVVRAVGSARDALAAIPAFHPDVLLSDIGMPGEDGYALIRAVRARERQGGGHVAAVALTAFAGSADREQALAMGFEAHLPKPASARVLADMVASLAGR
jgi:PAS domain S-box-containing protein